MLHETVLSDAELRQLYARESALHAASAWLAHEQACSIAFSLRNKIFAEIEVVLYLSGDATNEQLRRFDRLRTVEATLGVIYKYHGLWLRQRLTGVGNYERPYVRTEYTAQTYLARPMVDWARVYHERLASKPYVAGCQYSRGLFDGDLGFSRNCKLWWESVGTFPTSAWK